MKFKKLVILLILTASTGLLQRCGKKDKKKSQETADNRVPADWDLKSDWTGGDWRVDSL